jgi:hypothetical protein
MRGGRTAAAAVLAVLALAACGRKAPPVPPEQRLPAAVAAVEGHVRGDVIELAWTLPGHRADGTRLRDRAVARVFRAEDTGTGEPKPAILHRGRLPGYVEIAAIPLDGSPAVAGDRVTVRDGPGLARGRRYTYAVTTVDATGRESPPSPPLSLVFIATPSPPRDVVAEPGDREARLRWQTPATAGDGGASLTYEVLRAPGAGGALAPVTPQPVEPTAFVDRGLQNDQAYEYAVRAIRTERGTRAVSEPSPRVAVTPVDTTPPSPPRDLVAVPSAGAVRLSWLASPEPDVAGYLVHRGTPGGELVRVGAVAAPGTTFTDRDVPPGRYRYAVTAHDAGSRRNESGPSNEAAVSVP